MGGKNTAFHGLISQVLVTVVGMQTHRHSHLLGQRDQRLLLGHLGLLSKHMVPKMWRIKLVRNGTGTVSPFNIPTMIVSLPCLVQT